MLVVYLWWYTRDQNSDNFVRVLPTIDSTSSVSTPQYAGVGPFCARAVRVLALKYNNNTINRLSLTHISEPTRLGMISYAVFCLKRIRVRMDHLHGGRRILLEFMLPPLTRSPGT